MLSQSTTRDASFTTALVCSLFPLWGKLKFLFVSFCYCKSVKKRHKRNERVSKDERRVIMVK